MRMTVYDDGICSLSMLCLNLFISDNKSADATEKATERPERPAQISQGGVQFSNNFQICYVILGKKLNTPIF